MVRVMGRSMDGFLDPMSGTRDLFMIVNLDSPRTPRPRHFPCLMPPLLLNSPNPGCGWLNLRSGRSNFAQIRYHAAATAPWNGIPHELRASVQTPLESRSL